ncbi:MAG: di-trans,poly-cis-decaprenylcistransferase [Clostridiales bacterium]|nr:di-trans,poly-cis-decaprenylcistransferase [Clostridiales bacterium]
MVERKIPSHVAIIMDGNGRWAERRGKERSKGHIEGSKNVEKIATHAFKLGVKTLTLYAFSSENWSRPEKEVRELMRLLKTYLVKFAKKFAKKDVRLVVSGSREELSKDLVDAICECENLSKENKDFTLNIAINYGGRQEIVRAVNNLIKKGEEVTVDSILDNLYTSPFGEPDLIIRTGGEYRISNFLLFQGAYSELYFTDVLWPDFNETELEKALDDFSRRKRRFGGVKNV